MRLMNKYAMLFPWQVPSMNFSEPQIFEVRVVRREKAFSFIYPINSGDVVVVWNNRVHDSAREVWQAIWKITGAL